MNIKHSIDLDDLLLAEDTATRLLSMIASQPEDKLLDDAYTLLSTAKRLLEQRIALHHEETDSVSELEKIVAGWVRESAEPKPPTFIPKYLRPLN